MHWRQELAGQGSHYRHLDQGAPIDAVDGVRCVPDHDHVHVL